LSTLLGAPGYLPLVHRTKWKVRSPKFAKNTP
jgi:hypothetical protein